MQTVRSYHPLRFAFTNPLEFTVSPRVAAEFDELTIRCDVTSTPAPAREDDDIRVLSLYCKELGQIIHSIPVNQIVDDVEWKFSDPSRIPTCLKGGPLSFQLMEPLSTGALSVATALDVTYVNLVLSYHNSSDAFRKMLDGDVSKKRKPASYIC